MFDVIIVGGGPAGLSAALILGRCLRKVLVCDEGRPRNGPSRALHGFLTREGTPPADFLQLAREELRAYETVQLRSGKVSDIERIEGCFKVTMADGGAHYSRKTLLATGVVDELPPLKGIREIFGKSAYQCLYCDGWEVRHKPLAIYGKGERGLKLSLSAAGWSKDLILFTHGPSGLSAEDKGVLSRNGIALCEEEIVSLESDCGQLRGVSLKSGKTIARHALFFNTESFVRSDLLERLGCHYSDAEGVETGKYESTCVPGLYAAGNMCRDVQLVIVAAGEGAKAAFGINCDLTKEDRQ